MNLNSKDIDQILEALRAWEKEPVSSGFQKSLIGMMIGGLAPGEDREERIRRERLEMERDIKRSEIESGMRREQSILLQAKLIQLKQEMLLEAIAE